MLPKENVRTTSSILFKNKSHKPYKSPVSIMKSIQNTVLSVIIAIITFLLSSCSVHINKLEEGTITTKAVSVNSFDKLQVQDGIDVVYTISDSTSIMLEAGENVINNVCFEVNSSNVLTISYNHPNKDRFDIINFNSPSPNVKAYIASAPILSVEINGAGTFNCKDSLATDNFQASITGSGDVYVKKLVTFTLNNSITGSGKIVIDDADIRSAEFTIAGSGYISTSLRNAELTKLDISGSGNMDVDFFNCKNVSANIAGSGNFNLSGSVTSLDSGIAGVGGIETNKLSTGVPYKSPEHPEAK